MRLPIAEPRPDVERFLRFVTGVDQGGRPLS